MEKPEINKSKNMQNSLPKISNHTLSRTDQELIEYCKRQIQRTGIENGYYQRIIDSLARN